jgi:hypothetical protein
VDALSLISSLAKRGIRLSLNGDQIVVSPASKLTAEDRKAIESLKNDVGQFLVALEERLEKEKSANTRQTPTDKTPSVGFVGSSQAPVSKVDPPDPAATKPAVWMPCHPLNAQLRRRDEQSCIGRTAKALRCDEFNDPHATLTVHARAGAGKGGDRLHRLGAVELEPSDGLQARLLLLLRPRHCGPVLCAKVRTGLLSGASRRSRQPMARTPGSRSICSSGWLCRTVTKRGTMRA